MRVKALKDFISPVYGDIETGQIFSIDAQIFNFWASAGMVESMEIPALLKKIETKPAKTVLPEIKPEIKEVEKKRRGRPKKVKNADEDNHAANV
jgi:hypothetical protein